MLYDKKVDALIGSDLACSHDFDSSCDTCRLRSLCLPAALESDLLDALDGIIEHRLSLRAGELIYRQNQPFTALYAVMSGSIKTFTSHEDGWVRVTGCHLAGEIFGFSAINEERYLGSAQALETSRVCQIPFAELERLCHVIPGLQSRLLHLMSRRLVEDDELAAQFLHKRPARKRIAAFLLGLSTRALRRGDSPTELRLPMSRTDIGNYLGITLETVCRELSRLDKLKVISLDRRNVRLLDLEQLRAPICDDRAAVE